MKKRTIILIVEAQSSLTVKEFKQAAEHVMKAGGMEVKQVSVQVAQPPSTKKFPSKPIKKPTNKPA